MSLREKVKNYLNKNPFKGYFRRNRLRPPGAVAEEKFMELCIRCARCIEVCPYESVKRADLFDRLQIGTPYVYADDRACYLCMLCPSVCPTGALDPKLNEPEKVRMGLAYIEQDKCLNYLYVKDENAGGTQGFATICSTCYNVCPYTDEAIIMEQYLLPVITEKCTGCGICVEKCPTEPKSVSIIPAGMGNEDLAGLYYQRSRRNFKKADDGGGYGGDDAIQKKMSIDSAGEKPEFKFDYETTDKIDGWTE